MPLNKKQLGYGSVLMIAAAAFLWDHFTSNGPAPAEAAGAAVPAKAEAAPASKGSAAPVPGPLAMRLALGTRLGSTAAARNVEAGNTIDAFAIPADWLPKPPSKEAQKSDTEADLESGRAFAAKHVLNAVMLQTRGGYAILDGDGVLVGSGVANYRLTKVTKTAALFERGDVRVEFHLDAKPTVWRDRAGQPGLSADNGGTARTE